MHPFQSGRALRIAMLDRLIARMKSLPGVWFPTCEQVARTASTAIRRARVRSEYGRTTMPWKQGYTISDERSLADSEVRWPDDARCCVTVTVDLSVASGAEGLPAADLATPEALFGANQGLAALRDILRGTRYGRPSRSRRSSRISIAIWCGRSPPRVMRSPHTGFRHEDVSGIDRDEERRRIARTTEILTESWRQTDRLVLAAAAGRPLAVGAISPNTIDLLPEAGYVYLGNGLATTSRIIRLVISRATARC